MWSGKWRDEACAQMGVAGRENRGSVRQQWQPAWVSVGRRHRDQEIRKKARAHNLEKLPRPWFRRRADDRQLDGTAEMEIQCREQAAEREGRLRRGRPEALERLARRC